AERRDARVDRAREALFSTEEVRATGHVDPDCALTRGKRRRPAEREERLAKAREGSLRHVLWDDANAQPGRAGARRGDRMAGTYAQRESFGGHLVEARISKERVFLFHRPALSPPRCPERGLARDDDGHDSAAIHRARIFGPRDLETQARENQGENAARAHAT